MAVLFMDVLFDVVEIDVDVGVGRFDPVGDALGEEHGSMLSTGAAEGDHQVVEMPFQVVVDALSYDGFHMVEKHMGLWFFLEVFDYFAVASRLGFELWLTSWVGQRAAVEHEAAAVAAEVVGIAFPEREAVDRHGELRAER